MITAFHGDPAVKQTLGDRVARHIADGTLVIGNTYWDGVSGSPLGVSVEGTDVEAYVATFGYPLPLAGMLDPLTAMMGMGNAANAFVRDWVDVVAPGADLSPVSAKLMRHMVETAQTDTRGEMLKQKVVALHSRDSAEAPVGRAEWSAVRNEISVARDTASDDSLLTGTLALLDAACWPAGRGYTPLSATLSACIDLVTQIPDPEWTEADNKRSDTFFMAMEQELQPRMAAGEDLDFTAICKEREPEIYARYEAFSARYLGRIRNRASDIATRCLTEMRSASAASRTLEFSDGLSQRA
ncbi:hypothetical protein [Sphingomonas montana]|uniref:hypothetical protein n=1 Tax=Sphingomonas montana TaxID=1843236 RepID=UPI00096D8C28|nr:hypothetical protein [Sphingomonas montana]